MTDKPERRKHRDDSGDAPGEFLGPEIHRRLSEALEHPKEQEKAAQERPDRRYLSKEVHQKLSEASRQDRIDQPVETTRIGGIDAELEHSIVQTEQRQLPDHPDVEKTTQVAQQEGVGEQTDSSEQPLQSNPISRENFQSEGASGKHEPAEQPAEAKRTAKTDTKPEQMGEQKDPMVRQLPESQERESSPKEKGTALEQLARDEGRQTTLETQAEETRETRVERPDLKSPQSDSMPQAPHSKLEGREPASEHPQEQEVTARDKLSHGYLTGEMHEKPSETNRLHEEINKPSDTTRTNEIDAKSEQSIERTDLTGRQFLDKPERELSLRDKGTAPEQLVRRAERQTDRETQREKGGELLTKQTSGAKELPQINPELSKYNTIGPLKQTEISCKPVEHLGAQDEIGEKSKERAERPAYMDAEESVWRQAICEAIQDSNLKALVQNKGDLGGLKSYYEGEELGLVLRCKAAKATEGHNVRLSLPPTLTEAFMVNEGPVRIELIDPVESKTYGFYKDFHKVSTPDLDVPLGIAPNLQEGQDLTLILKMRKLPAWEFLNSGGGDGAGTIEFNRDGILVADLGGKRIPIQSLDYDYLSGRDIGGVAYLEFKVEDIYDEARRFRLYDNKF